MTQANRRAVRERNRADATDRRRGGEANGSQWLDRGAMLAAIDEFEAEMSGRYFLSNGNSGSLAGWA